MFSVRNEHYTYNSYNRFQFPLLKVKNSLYAVKHKLEPLIHINIKVICIKIPDFILLGIL